MTQQQPPVRRPRPQLRTVRVSRVDRITPHMVRITVIGDELEGFTTTAPPSTSRCSSRLQVTTGLSSRPGVPTAQSMSQARSGPRAARTRPAAGVPKKESSKSTSSCTAAAVPAPIGPNGPSQEISSPSPAPARPIAQTQTPSGTWLPAMTALCPRSATSFKRCPARRASTYSSRLPVRPRSNPSIATRRCKSPGSIAVPKRTSPAASWRQRSGI